MEACYNVTMDRTALITATVLALSVTPENATATTNCRPGSHYVVGHYTNVGTPPHRRWITGACAANTKGVVKGAGMPTTAKP